MNDARLTKRAPFVLGLVFFPSGLPCGLNAAPAPPPPIAASATPLTGKIARITILGNKNISADAIRTNLTSNVSDSYTSQATDKDPAALKGYGSGVGVHHPLGEARGPRRFRSNWLRRLRLRP